MKPPTAAALRTWRGNIPVSSLYTAGVGATTFLRALKDRGELLATRCTTCQRTYLPALEFCPRCFAELRETIPLKPEGELVSFTRVHYDRDARRLAKPLTVAAVRLDAADTVLIHYWLGKDTPRIGSRARVRLKPKNKRIGSILDIAGLTPAPQ
ncbi:MAG: Zn-ribbon domain-containing OB-fold protein [Terriglobia bacterium]